MPRKNDQEQMKYRTRHFILVAPSGSPKLSDIVRLRLRTTHRQDLRGEFTNDHRRLVVASNDQFDTLAEALRQDQEVA